MVFFQCGQKHFTKKTTNPDFTLDVMALHSSLEYLL